MVDPKSPYPRDADSEEDSEDDLEVQQDGDDEDDEGYYEQQATREPANPVNRALLDFVDTVPRGTLDWSKPDLIFAQYPALSQKSELSGKTVLHMLIESWTKYIEVNLKLVPHIRAAFNEIVKKYPELIKVRDSLDQDSGRISGQTVLYSAIASGAPRILENLVKSLEPSGGSSRKSRKGGDSDPLSQALAVRCSVDGREENSLHYALRSPPSVVSPKALKKLVHKATEAAVAAADSYGFTPLHYAVDYGRYSEDQYKIVKMLLKTGERPSLIRSGKAVLDFFTNDDLSVYQYHVRTRELFREKTTTTKGGQSRLAKTEEDLRNLRKLEQKKREEELKEQRRQQLQQQEQRERVRARPDGDEDSDSDAETKRGGPQPPRNPGEKMPAQGPPKTAPGPKGSDAKGPGLKGISLPRDKDTADPRGRDPRIDTRGPGARDESQQRQKPDNRPREPPGQDPKTPLKRTATVSFDDAKKEETAEDRKRMRDECSEKIKMDIKVQYLRTRSHPKAVKFLYGKNPKDIQISFEYEGLAVEADADTFKDSFQELTFDNVLKYVAFPAVFVRNWRKNPLRVPPGEEATRGRSDMLYFFQWLREKGVERILKVIVDDSKSPPHSDEAIEMSLKPFRVEVLDWSKPDLDPVTICNASQDLTEIVLHWSGNNAVLRAWSEPEGLRKLPDLSVINLLVDGTLESSERTKRYIMDFENRLTIPYAPFLPPTEPVQPITAMSPTAAADRAAMPPPPIPNTGVRRTTTGVSVTLGRQEERAESPARAPPSPDPTAVKRLRSVAVKGGIDGLSLRPRSMGANGSGTGNAPNLGTPPHRWLDSTDAFAQRIDNVWRKIVAERTRDVNNEINALSSKGPVTPTERAEIMSRKGPPRDIVVAVIDDGVDTTVEDLIGRVLTGRTFDYEEDGDRVRPWYVSEKGHGTIMASMIARVCRMAKIYPIRLRMVGSGIDSMSAARAIHAAVDRDVDIISMSWTVSVPAAKSELKAVFDSALQRAIDRNILMFCSSGDSGHTGDMFYPAGFRPETVIKIGAANPTGLPYDWAGSLERLDFIFPGVEVVQQHDNKPSGIGKLKAETGSSVATALGAGLAALVMYCARIAYLYGRVGLTEADFERLRRRDVMVEAIARFGRSTSEKTEGKFIEVWNRLDGRTRDLQRVTGDNKSSRDLVAGLARDLINTST
ncbi:hypothetical protein QBC47DRAFT_399689 [Echria macrotheca]|uniref:Peptidase S8/S53 domain-containing protein n=1 Tax=Echria macrotheca TaxID=438768 RepID=A0AAJ0FBH0_9PEZI|nr:hypothetical protein QBC47DRAFT_399689 [Echria macrotheca]